MDLFPDHFVAFVEGGKDIAVANSYRVNVGAYKKKYAIEPPKHLPELPVEFLEMQRKFYKRAIKEILEEVSQALRRGKDTYKSIWTMDGTRIKELFEILPDMNLAIVSRDKKFVPLKNPKLGYTMLQMKAEDQDAVRGKFDSAQDQWFR